MPGSRGRRPHRDPLPRRGDAEGSRRCDPRRAERLGAREDASGADLMLWRTLDPARPKNVADGALKQNITRCTTGSTNSAWPNR